MRNGKLQAVRLNTQLHKIFIWLVYVLSEIYLPFHTFSSIWYHLVVLSLVALLTYFSLST